MLPVCTRTLGSPVSAMFRLMQPMTMRVLSTAAIRAAGREKTSERNGANRAPGGMWRILSRKSAGGSRTPPVRHGPADVALGLRLLLVLALVVLLLAAGHAQLDLGPPLFEVHPQGHQCEAALLRLAGELGDLAL